MDAEALLSSVGLPEREARLYVCLLRYGTRPTTFVAKKTGTSRASAHQALHDLLKKGLVTKSSRSGIQHFQARPPEAVRDLLLRQERELGERRQKIEQHLDDLRDLSRPSAAQPKVEFFEGVDGVRAAFKRILSAKNRELLCFNSIGALTEFVGPEVFEAHVKQRIRDGFSIKAIYSAISDGQSLSEQERELLSQYLSDPKLNRLIRYAEPNLVFTANVWIYDDKVIFISSREEAFATILESAEISELFRRIHLSLWPHTRASIDDS